MVDKLQTLKTIMNSDLQKTPERKEDSNIVMVNIDSDLDGSKSSCDSE